MTEANPLLQPWTTPYGLPPFGEIKPEHFRPAFDRTMAEQKAAVAAIVETQPTFGDTIAALEKSGLGLDRVASVFFHLTSADTSDALQAIERDDGAAACPSRQRDLHERARSSPG